MLAGSIRQVNLWPILVDHLTYRVTILPRAGNPRPEAARGCNPNSRPALSAILCTMGELENHVAFLKYGAVLLAVLLGCIGIGLLGMGLFVLGNSIAGVPGGIIFGLIAVLLVSSLGRRVSSA